MSWRRLGVILKGLSHDSAFQTAWRDSPHAKAATGDGSAGRWSRADYLLASLLDQVRSFQWSFSDGKTPHPEPYPRPGLAKSEPADPRTLAYLAEVRRLNGAAPGADWTPEGA